MQERAAGRDEKRRAVSDGHKAKWRELRAQLERDLEAAEKRREQALLMHRERLSSAHRRVDERLAFSQQRDQELTEKLEKRVEAKQAAATNQRMAMLQATSCQARQRVQRALDVSHKMRQQRQRRQVIKLVTLEQRVRYAAARRLETLLIRRLTVNELGEPEHFLRRRAAKREQLRRQVSTRRLQGVWQTFKNKRKTTRELARSFLGTGVPGSTASEVADPEPEKEREVDAQVPEFVVIGDLSSPYRHGEDAAEPDAFERWARCIQSPDTLNACQALLRRLETKLSVRNPPVVCDRSVAALLKLLYPKQQAKKLPRYLPRVFLCAYMIQHHPEVVFNRPGEREKVLSSCAADMVSSFETLLAALTEQADDRSSGSGGSSSAAGKGCGVEKSRGSSSMSSGAQSCSTISSIGDGSSPEGSPPRRSVSLLSAFDSSSDWLPPSSRSAPADASGGVAEAAGTAAAAQPSLFEQLVAFDEAWVAYLEQFVAWKKQDAVELEKQLIHMSCEMEVSLLRKAGLDAREPGAEKVTRSLDLQAMVQQVSHDQGLLSQRIVRLSGPTGRQRLEAALAAARASVAAKMAAEAEPPSTAAGSRQEAPAAAAEAPAPPELSNEMLIWQLLHNRRWQVPDGGAAASWRAALANCQALAQERQGGPEKQAPAAEVPLGSRRGMVAALEAQVRAAAERALWSGVRQALTSGDGEAAVRRIAALLGEVGESVLEKLPASRPELRQRVRAQFDAQQLQQRLRPGAGAGLPIELPPLLELLDATCSLLQDLGSAARLAPAQAAQAQLRAALARARGAAAASQADAVVAALQLICAQMRLLNHDTAAAHLAMLAAQLTPHAAAQYAAAKFADRAALPARAEGATLREALPRTARWLAAVQESSLPEVLPKLEGIISQAAAATAAGTSSKAAASSSGVPQHLSSGLRRPSEPAADAPGPDRTLPWVELPSAVDGAGDWRLEVRQGLVDLVAAGMPVQPHAAGLPETLALDAERLADAQERFQELLLQAAAALVLNQLFAQHLPSPPPPPQQRQQAVQQLLALAADRRARLPAIAAETARLVAQAGGSGCDSATVQELAAASLQSVLRPDGAAFRALCRNLALAMSMLLCAGSARECAAVQGAVRATLARSGAAEAASAAEALAADLVQLAAVQEAVHGGIYEKLVRQP